MADKKSKSGFKKFFQNNRSLAITIPIVLVLVIVLVFIYVLNGRDNTSEVPMTTQPTQAAVKKEEPTPEPTQETTDPTGTEVTTLPKDERDKDQSEILRNPFAEPYMVSGIVYDKSGGSVAIVEAENKTYIVESGDMVEGYFKVVSIESDQVVLDIDGQEVVLTLSGQ